jgi:uncharacterized iron-regulated protein
MQSNGVYRETWSARRAGHCPYYGKLISLFWCPCMPRHALILPLLLALSACAHTPAPVTQAGPQLLLLGEVHDNAAGHAARVALLQDKLEAGWRPAIAMEQFDTVQQPVLDTAMQTCADADCVITQLGTPKGWNWALYTPVIALALQYKLPLYAANLSRGEASKVVKDGFSAALPADLITHYSLDTLPSAVLTAQENEVRDSHCGALPEALVSPMAKAQIARDIVMAHTLRTHAANGIVLIAGNGHVRGDIAVPFWLHRDGLRVHTVGFLEPGTSASAFDAAQQIPASTRADPCAGFKTSTPAG